LIIFLTTPNNYVFGIARNQLLKPTLLKSQLFFVGTFTAAKPPAQNNLEDASVNARRKPKAITGVKLPARVKVGIHGKK
jgi:hypothetical protein